MPAKHCGSAAMRVAKGDRRSYDPFAISSRIAAIVAV